MATLASRAQRLPSLQRPHRLAEPPAIALTPLELGRRKACLGRGCEAACSPIQRVEGDVGGANGQVEFAPLTMAERA